MYISFISKTIPFSYKSIFLKFIFYFQITFICKKWYLCNSKTKISIFIAFSMYTISKSIFKIPYQSNQHHNKQRVWSLTSNPTIHTHTVNILPLKAEHYKCEKFSSQSSTTMTLATKPIPIETITRLTSHLQCHC